MVPGVYHLGAPCIQNLLHSLLDHLNVVRLDMLKPVTIAVLRPYVLGHVQEYAHGPVGIHSWLAAVLKLNGPGAHPGPLQNILKAAPGLKPVFLLLLHHGVYIP